MSFSKNIFNGTRIFVFRDVDDIFWRFSHLIYGLVYLVKIQNIDSHNLASSRVQVEFPGWVNTVLTPPKNEIPEIQRGFDFTFWKAYAISIPTELNRVKQMTFCENIFNEVSQKFFDKVVTIYGSFDPKVYKISHFDNYDSS